MRGSQDFSWYYSGIPDISLMFLVLFWYSWYILDVSCVVLVFLMYPWCYLCCSGIPDISLMFLVLFWYSWSILEFLVLIWLSRFYSSSPGITLILTILFLISSCCSMPVKTLQRISREPVVRSHVICLSLAAIRRENHFTLVPWSVARGISSLGPISLMIQLAPQCLSVVFF